jgi:flagellar hook assembly protein FlgD
MIEKIKPIEIKDTVTNMVQIAMLDKLEEMISKMNELIAHSNSVEFRNMLYK